MSKARKKRPNSANVNPAGYDIQEPPTWEPPSWLLNFARDAVWPLVDGNQEVAKAALYRWLDRVARTDGTADRIRQLEQGRSQLELQHLPGWEKKYQEITDQINEILSRQGVSAGNAVAFASPLRAPFNRALPLDGCLVALLALNEETRDHSQRIRPTDNRLFGIVCHDVHELVEEHLPGLRVILGTAQKGFPPMPSPGSKGKRGAPARNKARNAWIVSQRRKGRTCQAILNDLHDQCEMNDWQPVSSPQAIHAICVKSKSNLAISAIHAKSNFKSNR